MLTIETVKKTGPEEVISNPTLKVVVLDVSDVEPAKNQMKAKFFAIVADQTGAISCTIYKEQEKDKFIKGMGLVLMNVMIKQSYIAITERTDVALCKPMIIPDEVVAAAPKLPGEASMTIRMIVDSPVKTLTGVKGKIVKVINF